MPKSMSAILQKTKSKDADKDKDDKKKPGKNAMLSFIAKCKASKD